MRVRNKAFTSYRDGKRTFKPGEVLEMTDHDAQELVNKLPWHFEIVKSEKPAPKPEKPKEVVPSPQPEEEPRRFGRGRSRE